MIKPKPPAGWPATEVLEEAVGLLRRTPVATVLLLFIGSVPFWLALLYFVADMAHSTFAGERLIGASLSLALLYLWKKCWAAVFARGVHTVLAREEPAPWTARRLARLVLAQAELQLWGLLVRPIAYLFIFPTAWISAYYQNLTALGENPPGEGSSLSARAWAQARLWPGQNHALIIILSFFWFIVFINVSLLGAALPFLLKTLLGIETMASRDSGSYVSLTFFSATAALAFMLIDPIWRAACLVRCYQGASLKTGEDIRASLRTIRRRAGALALLMLLALSAVAPAALEKVPPAASKVNPQSLDRSIEETLKRREFAWRYREVVPRSALKKSAAWANFIKGLEDRMEAAMKRMLEWKRWLQKKFWQEKEAPNVKPSEPFHFTAKSSLLYGAVILVAVLLIWALVLWRRQARPRVVVAQAVAPMPDLHSAEVTADQLPEDGWLQLARELAGRGELRLALRAVYLAMLVHLSHQQFVSIARHKSNRDYQRELRRRARSREALLAVFDENLEAFERVWYGDHGVTPALFEHFSLNLERMRAC